MPHIQDHSIPMILTELFYGTTNNAWDVALPFDQVWQQYRRLITDHGVIVLFGQEPFSSQLRMSNLKMYRYDWIWETSGAQGFLSANQIPLRDHENISIFYKHLPIYYPQFTQGKPYFHKKPKPPANYSCKKHIEIDNVDGKRYPRSVIYFVNSDHAKNNFHPTQKPVDLLAYLIKIYTGQEMTVYGHWLFEHILTWCSYPLWCALLVSI